MKAVLAVLLCAILLSGCCAGQVDVLALDPAVDVIVPEYEAYVAADEDLTEDDKRVRARTIELLKKLLDESRPGGVQ